MRKVILAGAAAVVAALAFAAPAGAITYGSPDGNAGAPDGQAAGWGQWNACLVALLAGQRAAGCCFRWACGDRNRCQSSPAVPGQCGPISRTDHGQTIKRGLTAFRRSGR